MISKYASSMLIPTPFVRAGLFVSHIIFVGDLIILSKSTSLVAANLYAFLSQFFIAHRFYAHADKNGKTVFRGFIAE